MHAVRLAQPIAFPLPRRARALAACTVIALLGGCSLFAPPERVEPPEPVPHLPPAQPAAPAPVRAPELPAASAAPAPAPQPAPVLPGPPVSTRHYQLGPATNALVTQAHGASMKGDNLTAMSTLERAVRIEPRNPLVWIEIAKVRLASGEAPQAESVARKAVALSEGDLRTSGEAWKQVAAALRAQGKNPEAAAADARANRPFLDAP